MVSFEPSTQPFEPAALIAHPPAAYAEMPGRPDTHMLISIPHAGRYYPPELVRNTLVSTDELRRLEDPLIDLLVDTPAFRQTGTGTVCAHYSRAWTDLNRRLTEVDPRGINPPPPPHIDHRSARVMAGYGLIPQTCGTGRKIYAQSLDLKEFNERINRSYHPYHRVISARLAAIRERKAMAFLLDLHSMPSLPPIHQANVVISNQNGRTAAPWLMDIISNWLVQQGLQVAQNTPYRGGFGVEKHGRPLHAIHAIQIEFDRALYLDESALQLSSDAPALAMLIARLAAYVQDTLASLNNERLAAE